MSEKTVDGQGSCPLLQDIVSHAQAYGFIYPSSEIYDGLHAVYDYGPYGVALKHNLKMFWWKSMTQLHKNIVGLDAAVMMHPKTWQASGHLDGFTDLMVDNKDSKKRYRVDTLLEEWAHGLAMQGDLLGSEALLASMQYCVKNNDLPGLGALLEKYNVTCPISRTANWTDVRQFNLMFSTQISSTDDGKLYMRPETAQGIFVNFLNVQKTSRLKIPFGIAQVGKAFRNEIVARQFIFRMREFEQMEMQFFVRPSTENQWFDYWKSKRVLWYQVLGVPSGNITLHAHDKLAHYATDAVDIQYTFPFGSREVEGIHSRTDFDLRNHTQYSGKKMQYFDDELKQSYTPYVIETSVGLDRLVLMVLCHSFTQDKPSDAVGAAEQKSRIYLKIPPQLAPVQAAIFPLVKKDGLQDKALQIWDRLKYDYRLVYEDNQSIGKRYVRQDLIGTPYCITVDYQTLEDHTVTIRERDSMQQYRMNIDFLKTFLDQKTSMRSLLEKLDQT